jgi:hypothetical protein
MSVSHNEPGKGANAARALFVQRGRADTSHETGRGLTSLDYAVELCRPGIVQVLPRHTRVRPDQNKPNGYRNKTELIIERYDEWAAYSFPIGL